MFKLYTKRAKSLSTDIKFFFFGQMLCFHYLKSPHWTGVVRRDMRGIFLSLRSGCGLAVRVVFVFLWRAPPSGDINTARARQRRLSDMVSAY